MKPYSPIKKLLPLLLTPALFLTGCKHCDLTNMHVGARVAVASLSIPEDPGGTDVYLEVNASGFHPNATGTVTIQNYPTYSGFERVVDAVTMDAQGALYWTKPAAWLWPPVLFPDVDPNVDIWITVSETSNDSGCFATTSIKQSQFQKGPF